MSDQTFHSDSSSSSSSSSSSNDTNSNDTRNTNINTTNTTVKDMNDFTLIRDSMKYLEFYRELQSKKLNIRLNVFKQVTINKYGSLDNIKNEGGAPIESKKDIEIIEKLIKLQTFLTIPICTNDGKGISHFYTLGLWYYWGIPEIIITFEKPLYCDFEFISILTNIIHDELF